MSAHVPLVHGTCAGYHAHFRNGIPFPEDTGGEPCGCRTAKAAESYKYRRRHGGARRICKGCGQRREIRTDRDGLCAGCWRDEKVRTERRTAAVLWSESVLVYGEWVNDHGVRRWVPRRQASA